MYVLSLDPDSVGYLFMNFFLFSFFQRSIFITVVTVGLFAYFIAGPDFLFWGGDGAGD